MWTIDPDPLHDSSLPIWFKDQGPGCRVQGFGVRVEPRPATIGVEVQG